VKGQSPYDAREAGHKAASAAILVMMPVEVKAARSALRLNGPREAQRKTPPHLATGFIGCRW
jgi:hypothetical protein